MQDVDIRNAPISVRFGAVEGLYVVLARLAAAGSKLIVVLKSGEVFCWQEPFKLRDGVARTGEEVLVSLLLLP